MAHNTDVNGLHYPSIVHKYVCFSLTTVLLAALASNNYRDRILTLALEDANGSNVMKRGEP